MKKIFKNICFTLFSAITCIGCTLNVNALTESEYTIEATPNVYYVGTSPDKVHSQQLFQYYLNGTVAYCIEPSIAITEDTYYGTTDLGVSNLSAETLRKIFLYAYYGYDYNNQTSINYKIATQILIWEEVSDFKFEFFTDSYGSGSSLSYTKEMNEIIDHVNNHYNKPSFANETINATAGEVITLTDSNNVLSNYEVYGDNIANVVINGNKLTFTPTTTGDISIIFKKKLSTELVQLIHYNNETQKMITRSAVDPVYFTINVDTVAGLVEFTKNDYDTKINVAQGDATLKGAVYGIYNSYDKLIETVITDENGYSISNNLPSFGTYYLKEITSPNGYNLDSTKYYFDIDLDNMFVSLKVYDKVITGNLNITKVYANSNTGIMTPESNVEFGFYNKDNVLIDVSTTDKYGNLSINIPFGTYLVKQHTTSVNYEKADDFHITIKSDGEQLYYVISNAEITGKLKVVKTDEDTGNQLYIKGIKFKIYDVDNGNYICQNITYPTNETICEYETDENGILITPYPLENGNYYLEEVDQYLNGYLWNSEKIYFSIGENTNFLYDDEIGKYLEIKFSNKEVKGQIEIIKSGETVIFEDGSFFYDRIYLENVKFGLYAKDNIYTQNGILMYQAGELIEFGFTNSYGYLIFNDLYLGNYYILELETENNHVLSTDKFEFQLKYEDQYTEIISYNLNIQNYLKKGEMEFTKTDLVTGEAIPNTKIEIYTEEDILIFSGYTDSDGMIKINNLFVGKFYIIETEPSLGYVLTDEIVYFEVLEDGEIIKANMSNKKITSTLEFTKTDLVTGEAIPNTKIEIYTEEDILIFSGYTDENGMIIIDELEYGKYYIIETNPADGYILTDEIIYFEVLEDGEIIKAEMKNELLIIEVPDTELFESPILFICSGLICTLGIVLVLYAKRK